MSARGGSAPSVYEVSIDVFELIEKMLAANHSVGPYAGMPRFEFSQVRFLPNVLGVHTDSLIGDEMADVRPGYQRADAGAASLGGGMLDNAFMMNGQSLATGSAVRLE